VGRQTPRTSPEHAPDIPKIPDPSVPGGFTFQFFHDYWWVQYHTLSNTLVIIPVSGKEKKKKQMRNRDARACSAVKFHFYNVHDRHSHGSGHVKGVVASSELLDTDELKRTNSQL
jgi:hypothetical protein